MPGGNCAREPFHLGGHGTLDVERVGGRQLDHAEADRFDALEAQLRGIGLGAELGAADVLQRGPASRRRRS